MVSLALVAKGIRRLTSTEGMVCSEAREADSMLLKNIPSFIDVKVTAVWERKQILTGMGRVIRRFGRLYLFADHTLSRILLISSSSGVYGWRSLMWRRVGRLTGGGT